MKVRSISGKKIQKVRIERGMNQADFWKMFHVTQSGGSRFENGRQISKPILILLNAYLAGADLNNLIADAVEGRRMREWKNSKPKAKGPIVAGGIGPNGMRMTFNRHA